MTKRITKAAALLIVLQVCVVLTAVVAAAEPTKVACIGDSITFGAGIRDRADNNYPVQLGSMLGDKWETRNFGVSGATMLKKGNKPYWKERAWQAALDYKPDVVIIKLGTNDTKPGNWQHKSEYAADYKAMIEQLSGLESKPQIWVCLPVPAYGERWGIREEVVRDEVVPIVRQVAKETGVKIIDLFTPLSDKSELFPDRIHPNAAGAKLMAEVICRALTGK